MQGIGMRTRQGRAILGSAFPCFLSQERDQEARDVIAK